MAQVLYFDSIVSYTLAALVLYFVVGAVLWYEFYYDVVLGGQYTFHIKRLHEQYGPIIRINPYELHVSDPSFIDTLYASSASGEKRDKWKWFTDQFGTSGAMLATPSHDLHRRRRAVLNRFFSMASVRRLQPVLDERLQHLLIRLQEAKVSGEVIPLEYALSAYTNDVVIEYSYGESEHRLDRSDWGVEYHDSVVEAGKANFLFKQITWILPLMESLPPWAQTLISPSMELIVRIRKHVEGIITRIKKQGPSAYTDRAHPTLFHEVLQSSLPDSEKTVLRLRDEAIIIVAAGTLTTSWALCVAVFYLLTSPRILAKIPLPQLEKLPWLTAIIQEALRLSYGVSSRLQRISPDQPLVYTEPSGRKWIIPSGTPVGMTSVLIHHDESIFADSYAFRPERWIENSDLTKYLLSFSKGSRQCLGMNLGYAEMYVVLAALFRRYGSSNSVTQKEVRGQGDEGVIELVDGDERLVRLEVDGFVPLRARDSKGIKIRVRL